MQALAQRLVGLAEQEMSSLKLMGMWLILHSIAKLAVHVPEAFLDRLAERITRRLREPPHPQVNLVAGVVWAFSRVLAGREPTPAQVPGPCSTHALPAARYTVPCYHALALCLQASVLGHL
jgi:hypothetical protein